MVPTLSMKQTRHVCIRILPGILPGISHFMLGQNVIFVIYDFPMTYDVYEDFHDFSKLGNQSFKFRDFSMSSMLQNNDYLIEGKVTLNPASFVHSQNYQHWCVMLTLLDKRCLLGCNMWFLITPFLEHRKMSPISSTKTSVIFASIMTKNLLNFISL